MPVGPYAVVDDDADRCPTSSYPAILKTARLGYDGKGQRLVSDASEMRAAWRLLGSVPLRARAGASTCDTELSVIVGRSASGDVRVVPRRREHPCDGILDLTVVPARCPSSSPTGPSASAMAIADALDYVGVLAVEFFVVGGELLVNEMAPRPHNSGHWTLDVGADLAVRAADPCRVRPAAGRHLDDRDRARRWSTCSATCGTTGNQHWDAALQPGHTALHLYGKTTPRAGRKMGHLTSWGSRERAELTAVAARVALSRRG